MLEPYANRPSIKGDARFTPEQLNKVVGMLDGRGWQVMTHAIGDAAVRMTLDAYEAAAKANPGAGARPPPSHRAHRDHRSAGHPALRPARRRSPRCSPCTPRRARRPAMCGARTSARSARRAAGCGRASPRPGGPLAFGSDWPVMTLDPLKGLHVAVTRTHRRTACPTADGSPPSACRCARRSTPTRATRAWASFDEQRKGTLARDMLADIVVLSDDIFSGPASRLHEHRSGRDDRGRKGRIPPRSA